ncbi:hypothetical protein HN011_001259 [Eciton burchellii]|nr:hypothetical protein HN011_001259 [Eciton burchellii]
MDEESDMLPAREYFRIMSELYTAHRGKSDPYRNIQWSQYYEDFKELGHIGSGSSSEIYKARCNFDNNEYAIKKIIFLTSAQYVKYLPELHTFRMLRHSNIVSYYRCWEEDVMFSAKKTPSSQNESDTIDTDTATDTDFDTSQFSYSVHDNAYQQRPDNCIKNNQWPGKSSDDDQISTCVSKNKGLLFYIQMTLYEGTLEQWMCQKINRTDVSMTANVLEQILCGLDYIHCKDIVHHDIKPQNIFTSRSGKELIVMVGNFGSACSIYKKHSTKLLGTSMYAAPEQWKGECIPKSDIYSVGIVLLQLLIPASTSMEFVTIIDRLKNGDISSGLTVERQQLAYMAMRMVQNNPEKRPSANELLDELMEWKCRRMMRMNEIQRFQ